MVWNRREKKFQVTVLEKRGPRFSGQTSVTLESMEKAVLRLIEEDARFRAAVREGIEQADRGEFIEEEMDLLVDRMLRP